jgi:membrane-anchored protein YejM (alkaline phosphatase superfamily)
MEEKNSELLLAEIRKLTAVVDKLYKRQSPWMGFVYGVLYSIGYFVGAAVIVVIVVYLLQRVPLIPIIGNWLGQVLNQAIKNVSPTQYLPMFK